MVWASKNKAMGAFLSSVIALSVAGGAAAAPLSVAGPSVLQATGQANIEQARYKKVTRKRHVVRRGRHNGAAGAAALGLFGAAVGAAIANGQRDDYYDGGPSYYPDQGYYNDGPGPGYYRGQRFRERRVYQPQPGEYRQYGNPRFNQPQGGPAPGRPPQQGGAAFNRPQGGPPPGAAPRAPQGAPQGAAPRPQPVAPVPGGAPGLLRNNGQ